MKPMKPNTNSWLTHPLSTRLATYKANNYHEKGERYKKLGALEYDDCGRKYTRSLDLSVDGETLYIDTDSAEIYIDCPFEGGHNGWFLDHYHQDTVQGFGVILAWDRNATYTAIATNNSWGDRLQVDLNSREELDFSNCADEHDVEGIRGDTLDQRAREADGDAEIFAEKERDFQLKADAENQIEEAKNEIATLKIQCREIVKAARETPLNSAICDVVRGDIMRTREEIGELRERIETLENSPWEILC